MRITAGTHRSRNLKTLESNLTRPTSDKVRQAIYSRVGPYFNGETLLDVFSGTGAMALEGLSRGMSRVTCIEKNAQARRLILENIKLLGEQDHVDLIHGDALLELERLNHKFDLVFIDPPYDYPHFEAIIELVVANCVHENSLIIVESDKDKVLPQQFRTFVCSHSKRYGQTLISYYEGDDNE